MRARSRPRGPLAVLAVLVAAILVVTAAPRVADAVGAGVGAVAASLGRALPSAEGGRSIDLRSGSATVAAAPVALGLPDFTKEPSLALAGRVPDFALAPGRTVDVALNGVTIASLTPDAVGGFGAQLLLRDGSNAVALTLRAGGEMVAASSYVVVLVRQPPTLTVTKPLAGATVDGPTVAVEGKTDPGSTVIVNDQTVPTSQDGSFSTAYTASAGRQTITVVARDRAGNETKVQTAVTVRDATTSSVVVSVALDPARVAPGAQVVAIIGVTANGVPAADRLVTIAVGLYTIGSVRTDASGTVRLGFAAPPNVGDAVVLVLTEGGSGRATLTVAR